MKENYFTTKNIGTRSRKMLVKVTQQAGTHPVEFKCTNPALLVIDMQKYFLDRRSHAFLPSALPIVQNIKKMIDVFMRTGRPTVLTQHINNRGNAGMLGEWWDDLITGQSRLKAIIPELMQGDAKVIRKSQYDAFFETKLETYLKSKKVDALIITGVMAHLCCETTARSAFVRGYGVYFVVDGTATQNMDFHYATLLNLAHGFAIPVLTKHILQWLKSEAIG